VATLSKNDLVILIRKHSAVAWGLLTMAAVTYAAYYDVIHHTFLNWDDVFYIQKNTHIQSLTLDNLLWMFANFDQANWHPITWLSLALDIALWDYNPTAFKLVNISIHILNCVLIYLFSFNILKLAQSNYHRNKGNIFSSVPDKDLSTASLLICFLFAIHPLHVESVTWIAERKDVLSAFFYILTLLCYIKHRTSTETYWLPLSVVIYFLSLMSKSMAVTLPVVLMILDIYPLRRLKPGASFRELIQILFKDKLTFIILALVVSIITLITQRQGIQGTEYLSLESRIINACMSLILYVYHYFSPYNLSSFYPYHSWSTNPVAFSLIPVISIVVFTVFLLYLVKRKIIFPIITWIYFVVTLLPVIGLVKVGSQSAADRYTYLPLLSFFIASAGGLSIVIFQAKKFLVYRIITVTTVILVMASAFAFTYKQNTTWRNDETLWSRPIEQYPGLAERAYRGLGAYYLAEGRLEKARSMYIKALAIQPDNLITLEELGKTHLYSGNEKLVIHYFSRIVQLYPDLPFGYTLLGDYYYTKQNMKMAKTLYNQAFQTAPNTPGTLKRKALVDYLDNDLNSAKQKIDYLLIIAPDDIGGLQLAARIYFKDNNIDKSKKLINKILKLRPGDGFAQEILTKINNTPDK